MNICSIHIKTVKCDLLVVNRLFQNLCADFNNAYICKRSKKITIGSGAPSSNDPKFERRPPGAPWPTFLKLNDAKLFLISFLKTLESLETLRSG
jgi:hypothetical protein